MSETDLHDDFLPEQAADLDALEIEADEADSFEQRRSLRPEEAPISYSDRPIEAPDDPDGAAWASDDDDDYR